jgi:kynurenine formamidase
MRLTDLTMPMRGLEPQCDGPGQPLRQVPPLRTQVWSIGEPPTAYRARVHYFQHWSMAGTYIDLPGHILETDDGRDAATFPAAALFRLPALLVRLDRYRLPGAVQAAELQVAVPAGPTAPALVLNALGAHRFDEIPERSVYLARTAVRWLVERGVTLLVSDIYESNDQPQDVFKTLFEAGVATVCCPQALGSLIGPRLRITALPLRVPAATQLPCRLLAEEDSADG